MPLVATGALLLLGASTRTLIPQLRPVAVAVFAVGMALYIRIGTPRAAPIELGLPVHGRWKAVNSPSSRVPSHGLHAWSQTYAIDLVNEPDDRPRPTNQWWPLARRPTDYPGFGQPVHAPAAGTVVRAFDLARDHWSRTSPLALLYFVVESVRELFGPIGVLGNYIVIRTDGGSCVLVAHLKRRSTEVRRGQRVEQGQLIGRCGNSGNSTEPHVHLQVMDKASVWFAAGLPFRFDGAAPPRNGDTLSHA
jgi:hypothetical protein